MANQFVARKGLVAKSDSQITGSLNVTGSIESFGELTFTSTTANSINSIVNLTLNADSDSNSGDAYRNIIFSNRGTETARIDADGNVGIGTTNPLTNLHVANNGGAAQLSLERTDTSDTLKLVIGSSYGYLQNTTGPLSLGATGGSQQLYIATDGDVGIGTTSPGYKLDISGSFAANYDTYGYLRVGHNLNMSANGAITIGSNSTDSVTIGAATGENRPTTIKGDPIYLQASNATRMYISGSGQVGIGTTSPSAKLHVYNPGNSFIKIDSDATSPYMAGVEFLRSSVNGGRIYNDGGAVQIKLESYFGYDAANPTRGGFMFKTAPVTSGTLVDAVRIDARGNVGIGTTTPANRLEVKSGGASTFFTSFTPSAGSGFIKVYQSSNNHPSFYGADASGTTNLVLNTSGVSYLKGGNVIIGGSADNGSTLQVAGDQTISGNLTVGGIVTAQEFHTEFVSASIVYSSGSTKFGDTADDVHDFTGSLNVEGNITLGAISPKVYFDDAQTHYIGYNNSTRLLFGLNGYDPIIFNRVGSSNAQIWIDQYTANYSFPAYTFKNDTNTGVTSLSEDSLALVGGGAARLYVASGSGNVGIGTTSPSYKLHVLGDASVSTWLYVNNIYPTSSTNDILINTGAGRTITLNPTSTGKTVIPNGNVGIGTTSPGRKLHISGSGTTVAMKIEAADGNQTSLDIKNSEGEVRLINDGGTFYIYDQTDSADRFRINTTGNVGIGESSPAHKLHIAGNSLMLERSGSNDAYIYAKTTDAGAYFRAESGVPDFYGFELYSGGTPEWFMGSYGTAYFSITSGSKSAGTRAFVIDPSANVGIGTTSPAAKLDVDGDIALKGTAVFNFVSPALTIGDIAGNDSVTSLKLTTAGDSTTVYLDDSGNVGIGTTSPETILEVSNASPEIGFHDTGAGDRGSIHFQDGTFEIYTNTTTAGKPSVNGTQVVTIKKGGNVGIGVTNPQENLHVSESIRIGYPTGKLISQATADFYGEITPFNVNGQMILNVNYPAGVIRFQSGSTEVARFTEGSLGIGTTNPAAKLDISAASNDGIRIAAGNALLGRTTAGDTQLIYWSGDHAYYGRNPGGAGVVRSHSFRTNGNTKMFITGSSVGINTQTPTEALTVEGNISASGDLYLGNNSTINFNTTTGTVGKIVGGSDLSFYSDNLIKFVESDDNIIRLVAGTNSGTFNINTTGEYNSAIKLYVNGDSRFNGDGTFTGDLTVSGIVTAQEFHTEFVSASIIYQSGSTKFGNSSDDTHEFTGSLQINYPAGGTPNLLTLYGDRNSNDTEVGILFKDRNVATGGQEAARIYSQRQGSGGDFDLVFATSDAGGTDTLGEAMRIDHVGKVGIGTTSPLQKLHLKDGTDVNLQVGAVSGELQLKSTNDADTAYIPMILRASEFNILSGNVGIGTTNPEVALEIGNVSGGHIRLASAYSLQWGSANNRIYNQSNDTVFVNNATESVRILGNGNVGIGTTSPSQKLEVRDGNLMVSSSTSEVVIGTASGKPRMQSNNNKDLLFSTPSYTNLVYLQESSGKVGIGTTSPNKKLTVEGAISASSGFYGDGSNLTGITTSDGLADILENDNSAGGFNLDMNNNDILGVDEIAVNIVNGISASLSYITASGDLFIDTGVGIGTQPNPTAALQVEGIISGSKIDLKRGGYITFYGDDDGTGDHAITSRGSTGNASDDLRINSFHNVHINLDSNNNNTSDTTYFDISQHGGTAGLGTRIFSVRGDGEVTVTGNLTVTGNTYATASWATDLVNIPDLTTVLTAGNGGGGLSITEVNDITATGTVEAGSFVETSARRFKENIEPIQGSLEIVEQLQGVTFNRIGEERHEYGFIADEVQTVAPELVSYDDTGQIHGVHYARTVAVLTEAVKELNDKVKAQDLFIKDLVARIEKLENK